MPGSTSIPAISLFSGGGGLDLGLAAAGFDTRLAVEAEVNAIAVLKRAKELRRRLPNGGMYLANCNIHHADIALLSDSEALRLSGLEAEEAVLLMGGPPCVTFSVAGKREGLNHDTGRLYRHFIRLVKAFRPQAFVFENVRGVFSTYDLDSSTSAFQVIISEFTRAGYSITPQLVDAADYGVPQRRHRLLILGNRGANHLEFPAPTHCDPRHLPFQNRAPWATVRDAFYGLPEAVPLGAEPLLANHVSKRHRPSTVDSYRQTEPGRRNLTLKRDRLLWDAPAKTVRAQGKLKNDNSGRKHSSHQSLHPDEPRQLTPRECARLQTFPDWYPFPANLVNAYRIIGDAVPCDLATAIGRSLKAQLGLDSAHEVAG
jgi:DNA (cytosine-5)-methyltransferase 1